MTTQFTVSIPEELASQLRPFADHLPQILELGLRQWSARSEGTFVGWTDVLETLAQLPPPETVLALRPARHQQERIQQLLEKQRTEGLLPAEEQEWQQYVFVEHLVRIAKAQAAMKVNRARGQNE